RASLTRGNSSSSCRRNRSLNPSRSNRPLSSTSSHSLKPSMPVSTRWPRISLSTVCLPVPPCASRTAQAISQNTPSTKFEGRFTGPGGITMAKNQGDFESQNESAKSGIISQIVRLVRKAGLDYQGWRYVSKRVRQSCELKPAKKGRKLPKILNGD